MHQFPKFTPVWNSTCFGQFLCPSSAVYSLYTRHWYMSYTFEDSFRTGPGSNSMEFHPGPVREHGVPSWSCSKAVFKPVWHIPVPSVQWINCWWWAEELPEACRISYRSKYGKFVHLVGFIIKKFVTMHGDMNVKKIRNVPLNTISPIQILTRRTRKVVQNIITLWTDIRKECVMCDELNVTRNAHRKK
jgi:hypothetical protein